MSEVAYILRRIRYGSHVRLELADGTCREGRLGRVEATHVRLLDDPRPVDLAEVVDCVLYRRTGPPE